MVLEVDWMLGSPDSKQLKAAEAALRAGRLDEAFAVLCDYPEATCRRTRSLRGQVAEAFVARARQREQQGEYITALDDLNKAEALGADRAAVADLRAWIEGLLRVERGRQAEQRRHLDVARRRMEAGSLAGAQAELNEIKGANLQAERLADRIEERTARAERMLSSARHLLSIEQFAAACRALEEAQRMHAKAAGIRELEVQAVREVIQRVRVAFIEQRLATAAALLNELGDVGLGLPERGEWHRVMEEARAATHAIQNGDWSVARRCVLRLRSVVPDAAWVAALAKELDDIDDLVTAVQGGALGKPFDDRGPIVTGVRSDRDMTETVRLGHGDLYTTPFQLLVDGAGSFLVLRQPRISIGRTSSGPDQPDIALMADVAKKHAEIARLGDDYVLYAHGAVTIGGKTVRQRLLEDRDRIELSPRVRMTFRLPSPRSATAVLELGGSQRLAGDVRHVVLMDRVLTLGASEADHISVPGASNTVVVLDRDGMLSARVAGGESVPLVDGESVELGGMRFVRRDVTMTSKR